MVPAVGGMILFGRERERHFPDAWIQAGRFDGIDKSRIIDQTEIRTPPPIVIEESIDFVDKHALRGIEIGRVRHEARSNYRPSPSVRPSSTRLRMPIYAQRGARFRVTMSTIRVDRPALDDTDQAIVDALAGGHGMSTSEIADVIGLTPRATRTRLARLVGSGLLREVGTGPQDPKRRYYRAE